MTEAQHMDGKLVGLTTQDPLSRRVYIDGTTNQRWSEVGLTITSLQSA